MTPVGPDKHPSTPVGAAHRFNKATGLYAAQPHGGNRVRIDVSVATANALTDAYEKWVADGDDTDDGDDS